MRGQFLVLLIAAAVGISGCASPVPLARNHAISAQYKLRSSHHWDIIAEDVVNQTLLSLQGRDFLHGRPLFVQSPHKGNAFQEAFHNFLITQMVNQGLPVADSPQGAVEVSYETQVVHHASDRPYFVPGKLTALTGGVMVVRSLAVSSPSPWVVGGLGLGAAAALDVAAGHVAAPTNTELIVTTSIVAIPRAVEQWREPHELGVPQGVL